MNTEKDFRIPIVAYVMKELEDNRINQYIANTLLTNLEAMNTHVTQSTKMYTYGDYTLSTLIYNAEQQVLHDNNLQPDYKGYGDFMLPLTQKEALELFDKGQEVYNIYENDAEGVVDNRQDIENNMFYYALEFSNEVTQSRRDLKATEFSRRLEQAGYTYESSHGCIGKVFIGDAEVVKVIDDDEIRYNPKLQREALEIIAIHKEVNEYVTAFQKQKSIGLEANQGYYALLDWNSYVLCAKQLQDNRFQFATWQKDNDGNGYNVGHYFENFSSAKEDFSARAELVNRDKLFTETEMKIIRSGLVHYDENAQDLTHDDLSAMKSVITKIDNVVVPEIRERMEQCKDLGNDYEHEL